MAKTSATIAKLVDEIARQKPGEIISTYLDEINIYTISELNERATMLAKGLLYINVQKGTPVALVISGTTSCLTFVVALAKIGALLVPLSRDYPLRVISDILKNQKVHTMGFLSDTFINVFKKLVPDLTQNERGYLDTPEYPDLKNIVTFGSLKNRGMFTTRELMLQGTHIDDLEIEALFDNVTESDVFMKKISWDKNKKYKFSPLTNGQVVKANPTLNSLQDFLQKSV
ncbi:MAG: AMP-binding protein [Prolixibacteraceae bacterium]|nr:AMP-binding protein [Prolixibacteraceae bacterium]